MGVFALEKYNTLAADEEFDMVQYHKNIGSMLCKIVNGIYHSNPIRDRNNNPIYADPPACTPQEFVKLTVAEFAILLDKQKTRLMLPLSEQDIASIEDEFQLLRTSYRYQEPLLKLAIERLPLDATFKASWSISRLGGRFNHLKEFAGGLASPFPHTATVESDFSIVKYETDNVRGRLENYSLEGIMQCKEHIRMKSIMTGKNFY